MPLSFYFTFLFPTYLPFLSFYVLLLQQRRRWQLAIVTFFSMFEKKKVSATLVVLQQRRQWQQVVVAFFFVFEKKKTTTMHHCLLLWRWCLGEEEGDIGVTLFCG